MPGSAQSWDQSQDPRENTVDLPRIDLAGLADYFRGAAPPPRRTASAPSLPGRSESPGASESPAMPTAAEVIADKPLVQDVSTAAATSAAGDPGADGAARARPPAETDEVSGPTVFAPTAHAARAATGSLADLRSRLARLPAGHPSSPYEDGGQARPLPTRLRQLELGLPAPGREPGGGAASRIEVDDSAHEARVLAEVAADLDLPPEPGQARPERESPDADDRPAERRRDPQWQDPYAADPDRNGHASEENRADSAGGPIFTAWHSEGAGLPHPAGNGNRSRNGNGSGDVRPEARRPDYGPLEPGWKGNGRTDGGWHDLLPEELRHPRPDREELHHSPQEAQQRDTVQHGTVGSHSPETWPDVDGFADLVEQTLARCQAAEGRNMFGTYGSSGLTPAMRRLAAQLTAGGLAPGSEADSLKPADRFTAKLSRLIARNPTRSPAELAETISDAVRYAFVFEAADYTEGTWLVHRKLKAHGFGLEARRNRWQSPEYKGIFTRWRDPAHGIAFEVQFHTTASWAVAKRTHDSYERITDPATPSDERAQLRARQVAEAASAKPPPGCMEIADFRGEPR